MVKQIHDNAVGEIRRVLSSLRLSQEKEVKKVESLIKQAYPFNEIPSNIIELYSDVIESSNEFKKTTELLCNSLLLS